MSVSDRTPRSSTWAPCARTKATARPLNSSTFTLPKPATATFTSDTRSSSENSGCLSGLMPTPTTIVSKIRLARPITSRWPSVIGSKEPV